MLVLSYLFAVTLALDHQTENALDIVSHINGLTHNCNILGSLIKENLYVGQTENLVAAATDFKSKVDKFTTEFAGYMVPGEYTAGFTDLVAACFDLCLILTQWVLATSVTESIDVLRPCGEAVFDALDCMETFKYSPTTGSVSPAINEGISMMRICADLWEINLF